MGPLGRVPSAVFAGDRRVWRAAAIVAVPLLALSAFYCLRPRFYFTGTNSVENAAPVVEAGAGARICAPALRLPADTGLVPSFSTSPRFAPSAMRMPNS